MKTAAALLLALTAIAPAARAQDSLSFRAAQDLAAAGRTDSARVLLRRIVIENANSPWADDALLRLAQIAYAAGNPVLALDLASRLRTDYPGSELRTRAALWGGRAAFDAGEPRIACALLDSAMLETGADIEHANQVAFYRARCTGFAAAPAVPAGAPTADSAPAAPRAGFEVQVAAARSDADARRIARVFETAGHTVRVAHGADGFTRVRIGPFTTREEADAAARAARTLAGGAPFVVPVP